VDEGRAFFYSKLGLLQEGAKVLLRQIFEPLRKALNRRHRARQHGHELRWAAKRDGRLFLLIHRTTRRRWLGLLRPTIFRADRATLVVSGPARVSIAETSVAGDHIRRAFFEALVMAVPSDGSAADCDNGAPRPLIDLLIAKEEHSNCSNDPC